MHKKWKRQGTCGEQELQKIFFEDSFSYFVAYQTDKFVTIPPAAAQMMTKASIPYFHID